MWHRSTINEMNDESQDAPWRVEMGNPKFNELSMYARIILAYCERIH